MSLDNIMMNEEKKEVIFLLGATGGIGKLLAEELKRNGYIVVGNGRKENVLIDMKNEGKIDDYIAGDLTKDEDRKRIIEKIKEYEEKGYYLTGFLYNNGQIIYAYSSKVDRNVKESIEKFFIDLGKENMKNAILEYIDNLLSI